MLNSSDTFKKLVLSVARRHLAYIASDPALGLDSRNAQHTKALDFYAEVLGQIDRSDGVQELYDLDERVQREKLSKRERSQHRLQDVLEVMGVHNNVAIFGALDFARPYLVERKPENNQFILSGEGLRALVEYLNQKRGVNYESLGGSK